MSLHAHEHVGYRALQSRKFDALATEAARDVMLGAIAKLPERQREVLTLRDMLGYSSEEARNALDLSETNQRVLLHRARSKVRSALERYFEEAEA